MQDITGYEASHRTSEDFRRVRIGIGHPGDKKQVHGYVLSDFPKADKVWVEQTVDAVADALPYLIEGDDAGFMTRVAYSSAAAGKNERIMTDGIPVRNCRLTERGKSTLNALTATAAAEAANYPFCTVEPNSGRVAVPDDRLQVIAGLAKSESIVPAQLEFMDIAGLVKGQAKAKDWATSFSDTSAKLPLSHMFSVV